MRSTESGFNENIYFYAAQERLQTAQKLLAGAPPDCVGASYFAGVAVECLFYAYRMRAGAEDTARHAAIRLPNKTHLFSAPHGW